MFKPIAEVRAFGVLLGGVIVVLVRTLKMLAVGGEGVWRACEG
jgi:hypothetical protein